MKKIMSVLLALVLVAGLMGAMGVSALAEGDGLTIVVTGGTGSNAGGGLSFAAVGAVKASYDENEVLLVDAGGFADGAAAIMKLAGYDLIVADKELDYDITSILMDVRPGVVLEKNGIKTAFVVIAPMGEQDADTYYETTRNLVTTARDKGADYVIALGHTDDADALAEAIDGIDILLTYGAKAETAGLPEEAMEEEADETAVPEENEEEVPEIDGEGEEPADEADGDETPEAVSGPIVLTVAEGFGSIGIVTIDGDGITAENMDAEQYAALGLEEDDGIRTLEEALVAAAAEEEAAETEEAEEAEEPAEIEEAEETAETEEPAEGEEADAVEEVPEAEEAPEEAPEDAPAEPAEEAAQTDGDAEEDASPADAAEEEASPVDAAGEETVLPTPVAEETPAEENTNTEAPAETAPAVQEYKRGAEDMKIDFEHPVSEVQIKNGDSWKVFEAPYYTLSNDNKTVALKANVLNDLGTGNYYFNFVFADGAADEEVTVNISGEYIAPTPEPEASAPASEPTPTPTAAPTATPAPTKAPASRTPATGDNSPILTYIIIFAVLAVAVIVVIVLVVRKGKAAGKH